MATKALANFASTEKAQAEIRRGTLLSLEARARFWDGVRSKVLSSSQGNEISFGVKKLKA